MCLQLQNKGTAEENLLSCRSFYLYLIQISFQSPADPFVRISVYSCHCHLESLSVGGAAGNFECCFRYAARCCLLNGLGQRYG